MGKGWGKKFADKRDWKTYNEELVVRGEFLPDLDWVRSWDEELLRMNLGKRGAAFFFPESLMKLQAVWHQWIDYRGIGGIARKLSQYDLIPAYNDRTTANRRIRSPEIGIELPKKGKVSVACDGTGMKMTNGGVCREDKYGKDGKGRKKFVKVIITADPNSKDLLGCEVYIEGEGPSEPEVAENHMRRMLWNGIEIDCFRGDGSFDTHSLFGFPEENGTEPAVKIRRSAVLWSDSPDLRKREIEIIQKEGYDEWAAKHNYGLRWPGTEGIFPAVKRKFGEDLRSRKKCNMIHEAKTGMWTYETIRKYAKR